jgi:hypothetical protein
MRPLSSFPGLTLYPISKKDGGAIILSARNMTPPERKKYVKR